MNEATNSLLWSLLEQACRSQSGALVPAALNSVHILSRQPFLAVVASIVLPWGMAIISGTGIAPAVAVMQALVPAAARMHLDPVHLGVLTAMAAHFGRTMSPVAAVVILSGKLSGVEPMALVKRVAPALCAGVVVLILVGTYWLLPIKGLDTGLKPRSTFAKPTCVGSCFLVSRRRPTLQT